MLNNIGLTEILVVIGFLVLLFGARRIPQVGRFLGQGMNNFYRALTGRSDEGATSLVETSLDRPVQEPKS